jgi:UDP-GlcNAc3NAcA epimerase
MKIVTILGARPQFIKAAAFSRAVSKRPEIQEIIVHTGQHYDANMSDVFFEQMQIPRPDHFLNIAAKHHGEMTGRMLEGIEKVLLQEQPDIVLIYGDTNSTVAGALAAKKLHIKVAHVEAGLRSYNMRMPEEINRIVADRISDYLFCPGPQAVKNLRAEGFDNFPSKVFEVGDIMKDVAYFYKNLAQAPKFLVPEKFVLSTIHRAENTDDPIRLASLIGALNAVAENKPVVLPLHPRTRARLKDSELQLSPAIILVDPVGYLEMVYLLKNCEMVITDSGGLQKEAFFFERPCITTRDETEWTELVENGVNKVVGIEKNSVLKAKNGFETTPPTFNPTLYGLGHAADNILNILLNV